MLSSVYTMIWLSFSVFSVFLYSVDSLLIRTQLLGVQRMPPRSGTSRRVRKTIQQWPIVHDYLSSHWYTISSRQTLHHEKRHRGSRSIRLQQQQTQQQESPTPPFEQSTSSAKIPAKDDIRVDAVAQDTAAAAPEDILATVPRYKSILTFVVTTAIILLSEPLLSLVDTIAVGHFGTTNQLAALGPATMICDSSIYFLYFLPIATTNRLATAMAQKQSQESIRQIISQNLCVAALFGLAISLSLALFGKRLLQWIILRNVANSSIATLMDVLTHAHSYILIRSIGATASVMGMVAQAICLASLDLRTPALAVISASVSNLLGDYFLARKFGSNGAAAATALATITSATVLLSANRKRLQRSNNGSSTDVSATNGSTVTRKDTSAFLTLPDKKSFLQLFQLAGPIFLLMLGKIICYNAMTLRANGLGVVSMAAHSILLRLFFFFGVFADGLNQAAQTFFPAILYGGTSASTDPSSTVNKINGHDEVINNRKQSSDIEPQGKMIH
jgi:Na+-driven multidrug efflux pump